jgi:PAS domain S-box-containing protein
MPGHEDFIREIEQERQRRIVAERQLREKEQRINEILTEMLDIFFAADGDGRITEISPSVKQIFDRRPEELIGQSIFSLFTRSEEREAFKKRLASQKAVKSIDFQARSKTGKSLYCSIGARIRSGSNDRPESIIGSIRDITPQVAAEQELLRSEEQLHQSQKMEALGTLVAGAAHEINNPINLIVYNIPLLKKVWQDLLVHLQTGGAEDPPKSFGGLTIDFLARNLDQMLSDMDLAAQRVVKIVSDLKNFSRQTNVSDKTALAINQAVTNAMRLIQTTVKKAGIAVELDLTPDLPLMEGNLQKIEQIVLNILINAVQAIEHDQGRIQVQTGMNRSDGNLFVRIADNGSGIDPAVADRLFDPFVTTKQDRGGTGLGLSVSYSLLKAHRGDIVFESRPGAGTIFMLLFPTVQADTAAKILIVDDDPAIRKLLTRALTEQRSYLVDEAANGIEACIKLGSYRPALLVLDIFMPDMDGVEVCRALKKDPALAGVKVMITTGFPQHPKVQEVLEMGYMDIHRKPFNLAEFLDLVDNILTK